LNRVNENSPTKPQGELKGIFKSVDYHGTTILVHLESEEFLELKVTSLISPSHREIFSSLLM
jgi:hypothetical protein